MCEEIDLFPQLYHLEMNNMEKMASRFNILTRYFSDIRRLQTSKPQAPPPPQKFRKVDSFDVEEENTAPTFAASMPKKEHGNEPQGLAFRKLGADTDMEQDCGNEVPRKAVEDQKLRPFAHNGETLLATFYGMLYTNDCTEKEWKLEIDGFIPICFLQVHGNPNKPFKIIAVENSRRVSKFLIYSYQLLKISLKILQSKLKILLLNKLQLNVMKYFSIFK